MQILIEDFVIDEAGDIDILQLVDLQSKMAYETEGVTLDEDIVEKGILAVIEDDTKGKYYKIVQQGKMVGCMLNTFEWSDWRNGYVLWIQSLYFLPQYRRRGLFKAVFQYVRGTVQKNKQLKGIRLYVDKKNEPAIEAYKSVGMTNQHYEMFEWLK